MFSVLFALLSQAAPAAVIDPSPPLLVTCQVQAFLMPAGEPNPGNQVVIATELLEKGVKLNRIEIHERVKPGSFYAMGEVVENVFGDPAKFDMQKHKEKVAWTAKKAFLISFNFKTLEDSIRVLGCSKTQLE